jgi:hypothetical protein
MVLLALPMRLQTAKEPRWQQRMAGRLRQLVAVPAGRLRQRAAVPACRPLGL